jgi:hypothetical protein
MSSATPTTVSSPKSSLSDHHIKALAIVRDANLRASERGLDSWQFAVELRCLEAVGLTPTDLRQLIVDGLVLHAEELASSGQERVYRELGALELPPRVCFVLTDAGAALAATIGGDPDPTPVLAEHGDVAAQAQLKPVWDSQRRRLLYGGRVVKQFRVPAPNQVWILEALQELGWPPRIDDPLPRNPEIDPRQRLLDTLRALNSNQLYPVLRFRGDGTGTGILWEVVDPDIQN